MKLFTQQGRGRTLLLAAVMVVGAVCVSYGGDNPAALAGRWIFVEGYGKEIEKSMELFSDGTGVVDDDDYYKWKAEDMRLRLLHPDNAIVADYSISDYELVLTYNDGEKAKFVRKEKMGEYEKKKEKEEEEKKKEEERIEKERLQRIEEISSYFTDSRDKQKYRTVKIGNKTWMAENLNYQPQAGKSWCHKNNPSACAECGRLYDWNAATTVCPEGWHLSSRQEWHDLATAAGGAEAAAKLKVKWWSGTDDYGFSALPCNSGSWWTGTGRDKSRAYYMVMKNSENRVLEQYEADGNVGRSVRCVQDTDEDQKRRIAEEQRKKEERIAEEQRKKEEVQRLSTYFTDPRDGQKYRAIKIDNGTWMAQNLNYQPKKGQSWCYGNDNSNCDKYGRLYDWKTAKKVCPAGWHLPEYGEWKIWKGTTDYRFSALPGGTRELNGDFRFIGLIGVWWTAMSSFEYGGAATVSTFDSTQFKTGLTWGDYKKYGNGHSVRCKQNN